jgi:hypothetical protein
LIAFRFRILQRNDRLDHYATQRRQYAKPGHSLSKHQGPSPTGVFMPRGLPAQSGSNFKTRLFVADPKHQSMAVSGRVRTQPLSMNLPRQKHGASDHQPLFTMSVSFLANTLSRASRCQTP